MGERPQRIAPPRASAPDPVVAALATALEAIVRRAVERALVEYDGGPPRPEIVDRAALAIALDVCPATVSKLASEGMPRIMVGDSPRYRIADCIAWLEQRTRERKPEAAE